MSKNKFTNSLTDLLIVKNKTVYKMWGGLPPVSMGDGVKFRVTKSTVVDYVYIRYLSGFKFFEIEFGILVGMDYDITDRLTNVSLADLVPTISRKVFDFKVVNSEKEKKA